MASFHIGELPENIYFMLKQRAEAEHRSIAEEAIVLLAKGLDTSIAPERRTRLLQRIVEEDEINSGTAAKLDPVELIREDEDDDCCLDTSAAIGGVAEKKSSFLVLTDFIAKADLVIAPTLLITEAECFLEISEVFKIPYWVCPNLLLSFCTQGFRPEL